MGTPRIDAFFVLCLYFERLTGGYTGFQKSKTIALTHFLYFFICTASHGVFDDITTGGLGVAFFSPFDPTRYFFDFRPIQVSPIGIDRFFSVWELKVLLSELKWIWVPSALFVGAIAVFKQMKLRSATSQIVAPDACHSGHGVNCSLVTGPWGLSSTCGGPMSVRSSCAQRIRSSAAENAGVHVLVVRCSVFCIRRLRLAQDASTGDE